jgi:pilus assembly protein CpaF
MEQDMISLQDIFMFDKTGINEAGRVSGRFRAMGVRPRFCERLQAAGIVLPAQTFQTVVEVN